MDAPPRVLTIAGSDSGGGAGIQADLKTFAAHRVFGMSVITSVTAQNTVEVRAVHRVPPSMIRAQIEAVFDDIGVDAVKIGMLGDAETVTVVADALGEREAVPIVLDPVMVAKSGDRLLTTEAVDTLLRRLLPLAALVTPNLPEAATLAGRPQTAGAEELARLLAPHTRGAVLIKGGHGLGEEVVDLLFCDGEVRRFRHPRRQTRATHGTGCTLSAAIAARLAGGEAMPRAVETAIDYLQRALAAAYPLGAGYGPVDHLVAAEAGKVDG